ncbi:MAG TPA: hypothetical protein VG297_12730 [Bryobacteraceae bacterium]|nr:hypothetical protein [Bryobacteraceae bacterium]
MTIRSERLQRALLFAASRVVPAAWREEWLAEWLTELWYARDENPARAGGFCRGAVDDALWIRRNTPLPRGCGPLLIDARQDFPAPPPLAESRFPESPAACIALLGFFAAAAATLALCFRGTGSLPPGMERGFLLLLPVAFAILPVTTTFSLGEYPSNPHWPRRWIFLAAKLALIFAAIVFGVIDLSRIGSPWCTQAGFWGAFWGSHMAMRWAFADQRARCPVCLRRLANPVRMGNSSRILLEWNGTELLCPRGHGLLHVPERPAIWFTKQRWMRM